ncbi:MAG: nucleotidyltransferase family protein [Blautia marasmi]
MPPYARILGFKKADRGLLREIKEKAEIPLITKAADYQKLLDETARKNSGRTCLPPTCMKRSAHKKRDYFCK